MLGSAGRLLAAAAFWPQRSCSQSTYPLHFGSALLTRFRCERLQTILFGLLDIATIEQTPTGVIMSALPTGLEAGLQMAPR